MKDFVALFESLDGTTKTNQKIEAMVQYFQEAEDTDKLFAIAILIGNKPKRPIKTTDLRLWASEVSGTPLWLVEESYYIVGDLAETISLILPPNKEITEAPLHVVIKDIIRIRSLDHQTQRTVIVNWWLSMSGAALFLFNKLLTGNFRVGVSRKLVVKALAKVFNEDEAVIEHRLIGKWNPLEESMQTMFHPSGPEAKLYLPYPFFLAYSIENQVDGLGNIGDWILEPKLDGIRGQLIVRDNHIYVWSRGEELMNEKFVEFMELHRYLPDGTVIDGEVIPWKDGRPLDFLLMQTRIGRKNVTRKFLEDAPLVMVCYDLLEWEGRDIRQLPLNERRKLLSDLLIQYPVSDILLLSEEKKFDSWEEAQLYRDSARHYKSEGLMLKKRDSVYEAGRKRGNWWKWKTEPMTIDGVLIYAQSGHGRRANLFTDYTFAVWDNGQLVPFTKAYSGLTDKELITIDNWIKRNTIEKFGPVRSVKPELVFELAFEGINLSKRHKSGVALRFPRIVRWRHDKPASEANTKNDLLSIIAGTNE